MQISNLPISHPHRIALAGLLLLKLIFFSGTTCLAEPKPETDQNRALVRAVQLGDAQTVRDLLARGVDPNSPYYYKVATNIDEYVDRFAPVLFLALGWTHHNIICLNEVMEYMRTVSGNLEIAKLLIDAGADVEARTDSGEGESAMEFAVRQCPVQLVQLLLKGGAKIATRRDRIPLLHEAASNYRYEAVRLLLRYKADVNERDSRGRTALMFAAMSEPIDLSRHPDQLLAIRILIRHGADVGATDARRDTALDHAEREEVKQLLADSLKPGSRSRKRP